MEKVNCILSYVESHISKLLILSCLFLLQCNDVTEEDKLSILKNTSLGFTKITGNILNRDFYPNTNEIIIDLSHVSGENRVTQIKIPINDDGTFYFEFYLARSQDVTIKPYFDFLYLIPGDSLHVEIDFKKLSDVRLSGGKVAEINNDFTKFFNATGYENNYFSYRGVGTYCEENCSWAEIKKQIDEERDVYRSRRQSFLDNNKVCDEVILLTDAMIELDYYKMLMGIIRNRTSDGKETMDKESMMNEINEVAIKYINSDYYSNSHFKFISSAYIPAAKLYKQPDTESDYVDWVKEVAKTDEIKDYMFVVSAGGALVRRDLKDFENYSANINNDYLLERLMQEYNTTMAKMQNPERISDYILGNTKDFNNSISIGSNNFLANKIAQNHGKVQVINICNKGCPACKSVLEQSAMLMKEYDKDVDFSFVCLGGDNKEARAFYRERGIDDNTIYFSADGDWLFLNSNFAPMGVPYGILVNRKGVIVDYGSHIRPGKLLTEKINLLLEKDNLIK